MRWGRLFRMDVDWEPWFAWRPVWMDYGHYQGEWAWLFWIQRFKYGPRGWSYVPLNAADRVKFGMEPKR